MLVGSSSPVVFLIPVIPRALSPDWAATVGQLEACLHSLIRQSSSRWLALVISNDNVASALPRDHRVKALHFPGAVPDRASGKDRHAKRLWAASLYLAQNQEAFFFRLDADDLASRRLVRTLNLLRFFGAQAIQLRAGYYLDLSNGRLGIRRRWFERFCGSTYGIRITRKEAEQPFERGVSRLQKGLSGRHADFELSARQLGKLLFRMRMPLVAYTVNSPSSLSTIKGRERHVREGEELSERRANKILVKEFGYAW